MSGPRRPGANRPAASSPAADSPATDDDAPAMPADAVEVARVLGAWGVKGGIKLKAFSADPQALFSSKRWFVLPGDRVVAAPPGAAAKARPLPRLLRIIQAREQGDGIVATSHELTERDAAEAMAGARIFVPRSSFPTPDDDEFYWVDLIGLSVRNRDGLDLGIVATLIETGPHCVLSIRPAQADAEDVLIPFVDAYVDRVDREARVIHVDWDPSY